MLSSLALSCDADICNVKTWNHVCGDTLQISWKTMLTGYILQGYIIYSIRKKLRKQYSHLNGKQIEKLKKSGVEVCNISNSNSDFIFYVFTFNELSFLDYRHYIIA